MTDKIEMTPEQRAALYTVEQWREILDAYVRQDEKNPLLAECLGRFEVYGDDDNMPEDENGFLHSAMRAVGEGAYWRLLEPLAEPMSSFATRPNSAPTLNMTPKSCAGSFATSANFAGAKATTIFCTSAVCSTSAWRRKRTSNTSSTLTP